MNILLNRRGVMMGQRAPLSTMIPYIRGGADGSYIDTGITPDETTRVIVWARNISPHDGYVWVLGSRVSGTSSGLTFCLPSAALTGAAQIQFGDTTIRYNDAFRYLSNYHKYEISGGQLLVDDTVIAIGTSSTFSNSHNIYLFGLNNNGSFAKAGKPFDICACMIYKGGVLVRDYIPISSPSIGLYDAVSDTIFTNAGNGTMFYGEFNKDAYTPLEYIKCTGAQYFDSGIKGSYSLPIITKFQSTETAASSRWVLGGRTSSTSGRCDFQVGNNDVNKTFRFGYQSAANTVYNSASQTNANLVWIKTNNTAALYKNNAQLGTVTGGTGTTFQTTYNIGVGTLNNAGTLLSGASLVGKIHYVGLGTLRNYVPAEVNGIAGMYDTYNDTFHPSASGTAFIAGTLPQFYNYLIFDGVANIQTDLFVPSDGSIRVSLGKETNKAPQSIFGAVKDGTGFVFGAILNSNTTTTARYFSVRYNHTSSTTRQLAFSYDTYGFFLTRKYFGWGDSFSTGNPGNTVPDIALNFGSAYSTYNRYSGRMGTVYIYNSATQNVNKYSDFSSYTPVYTLRPCIYNGEVGFWCDETSTFYGNTAGEGQLTVSNS